MRSTLDGAPAPTPQLQESSPLRSPQRQCDGKAKMFQPYSNYLLTVSTPNHNTALN